MMNKLVIPSILAATVLIAGIFAFMPIEKVSTVHTTITSNLCTALYGTATCPGVLTAVTSTVAGGATSANISEQDGFIGATTAGAGTTIVVAAEVGKTIKGQAILTTTSATAGDTCALQDTGGTVLIAAVAIGTTTAAAIESGVTPGFVAGEGLQVVGVQATARCTLSINTDNITG